MSIAKNIHQELRGDFLLWIILALLSAFSLLAVYSSTGMLAWQNKGVSTEFYIFKHIMILLLGFALAYLGHLVYYMFFARIAPLLLMLSIFLLILTLAVGPEINEARRWLEVPGLGITFQPSDLAKLSLIIYLARILAFKQKVIKDFHSAFIPIVIPVLLVCGLIAPADLSSAALLFITCLIMMYVGRVDIKHLIALVVLGLLVLSGIIVLGTIFPDMVRVDTWLARISEFMGSSEGGYQIMQSKIAIADGGWLGVGIGDSVQRNYIPYPYADFIYAIICEEYGVIGGGMIVFLYVLFLYRSIRLVSQSPKTFGALMALGVCLSIVLQAFINIAVAVHLVPVTGITLPMISMGGTSILFTCMAFGLVLSVSRYIEAYSEKLATQSILKGNSM